MHQNLNFYCLYENAKIKKKIKNRHNVKRFEEYIFKQFRVIYNAEKCEENKIERDASRI